MIPIFVRLVAATLPIWVRAFQEVVEVVEPIPDAEPDTTSARKLYFVGSDFSHSHLLLESHGGPPFFAPAFWDPILLDGDTFTGHIFEDLDRQIGPLAYVPTRNAITEALEAARERAVVEFDPTGPGSSADWPNEYLRFRSQVALGFEMWSPASKFRNYTTAGDSVLVAFEFSFPGTFLGFGGRELNELVLEVKQSLFNPNWRLTRKGPHSVDIFDACLAIDEERPICGPHQIVISSGVSLSGLSAGPHKLVSWLQYRGPGAKPCPNQGEGAWCLSRTEFTITVDAGSRNKLPARSETKRIEPEARPPITHGSLVDMARIGPTAIQCAGLSDGSEYCRFKGACLDPTSLRVVLLHRSGESSPTQGCNEGLDGAVGFGDGNQIPWTNDPSECPIPHRSFMKARSIPIDDIGGPQKAWWMRGTNVLINGPSPGNIGHQSKFLLKSWIAQRHSDAMTGSQHREVDRLWWVACARNLRTVSHDDCLWTKDQFSAKAGAMGWFDGLARILFGNITYILQMDDVLEALHGKDNFHLMSNEEQPLICMEDVIVPGENYRRFLGPPDARRFRELARRSLGLSRTAMRPPAKLTIIQRKATRRINDLWGLLRHLNGHLCSQDIHADWNFQPPQASATHREIDLKERSKACEHQGHSLTLTVAYLEGMSFREQAELFATSSVVVSVHGAALANLIFLPSGAAVVELKQKNEFSTIFRDGCSSSELHHFAVHTELPSPTDDNSTGNVATRKPCRARRELHLHSGAPSASCPEQLHHAHHDLAIEPWRFAGSILTALRATGAVPASCECVPTTDLDTNFEVL